MNPFKIAIIGCGTVGGGVAKIIKEINSTLSDRAGKLIVLDKIVELNATVAIERFGIDKKHFCGGGEDLSAEEAANYIKDILNDPEISIVVETVGGTSDFVHDLCVGICKSGKHLVSANKALLAERGKEIFKAAEENNVSIGFEAAVCGAIPIIKTIKESFSGDEITSVSGILNGTSNYILSRMLDEKLDFDVALKLAQEAGYAEADPTLDINGGDAAHKLIILMKLVFGIDVSMEELKFQGIQNISATDMAYAQEIDSKFKLICYAKADGSSVYGTVAPMMVKNENFLSDVNGATNAVRTINRYSGKHILIGAGAGSSETASSIVADIMFIARYNDRMNNALLNKKLEFKDLSQFTFPYVITFETEDKPGITGLVTTEIGKQDVNIFTVTHNRHVSESALFSIETQPCTLEQINAAIERIKTQNILKAEPKVFPILY
ncbi:MAG: homoserine dehydrogenase [Bacteroidales bacterium]|nr:homoserine dehydrogenase [Bacteroidales bacterium]MBN2819947.1 homoserine dehydrogenase [Bacteroidales bacterium]